MLLTYQWSNSLNLYGQDVNLSILPVISPNIRMTKTRQQRSSRAGKSSTSIVDRLADWLTRRPRPVRSAIAIAITVLLSGSIAMLMYGYLIGLPTGSLNIGSFTPATAVTVMTILIIVATSGLYWLSWRLLVGWNDEERAIPSARGAALWVMFAIVVLVVIAVVMSLQAFTATRPT